MPTNTSLVVILDDGSANTETLSLGARKTTFDGVDTGREVTVQMAIVVDTPDGKYLISDILEKSINQSLTEPSFSGNWFRVRPIGDRGDNSAAQSPDVRLSGLNRADDPTPAKFAEVDAATDFQYDAQMIANGAMYYIGYNENFANYTAGTASYTHSPNNPKVENRSGAFLRGGR